MMDALVHTSPQLMAWGGHLEALLAFTANGVIPVPRCKS